MWNNSAELKHDIDKQICRLLNWDVKKLLSIPPEELEIMRKDVFRFWFSGWSQTK